MGLAVPRPAMRARESRLIRLKLCWHALRTGELEARGMSHSDASHAAMVEARSQSFAKLDSLLQKRRKESKQ